MGSWNHTCAISNLHVTAGQDVMVFLLLEKTGNSTKNTAFCYGNALYDVVPVPFYGKYDDYGGVEDCHGVGLPIVLEHLKQRLYEFKQGPNQYHDCEVNPENLTVEKLFEADHEGRLGIKEHQHWPVTNNEDLDDLLEQENLTSRLAFRRVTHVVVHGEIAKAIMEKWYIERYVGGGKGTAGYNNNYTHVYYKDVIDSIPEYVQKKKDNKAQFVKQKSEAGDPTTVNLLYAKRRWSDSEDWNSPNQATQLMSSFSLISSSNVWGLIDVTQCVREYEDRDDWEGLAQFAKEVLTAVWIDAFMSHTRKIWVKQTGVGSQNNELQGYEVLAEAVLNIINTQRNGYED